MATSKTNTSNKKTSGKDVKSLSKQLSQVSAQAKSLGINNADTRKADSMVRQTEAQGSKKYAGSAFDTEFQANEKVINSMTLKPTGTVKYPEYKDTPVDDFAMNNAGLTGGESGITTDGTNLNVEQPKDEYGALTKIYEDYNKSLTDAQDDMTTGADVQKKLEKETKIKQLRQEEADYASQINTITANRDAAVLSLEGQGRGQTEGFVGGEQARINREAAIKALPIQAQLAAAQNKVQLAQDHINTWGAILMQDAQNKYNFKKEQFGALKDYLTDVEKMRLAKLEKENDRKYAEKQNNIQQLTAIMADAAANGQGGLISQIKTLNPETVTAQQLLSLAGQLRKPTTATKRDTQVVGDKLIDMQTGEVISDFSKSPANDYSTPEGARQYETQKADIQMGYNTATKLLENKTGLNLSTGAYQSPAMATLLKNVGGSVAGFGVAGSVVPGIGTAAGLATGLGVGLVTAPSAYSYNRTQKDQFLADASFLINDSTFAEIRDMKAQGVTFGNMTEGERIAAGRAATNLASAAIIDESGMVTGFRGSADNIEKYIRDIQIAYEGRQEYLDKQYAITQDDEDEAATLWGRGN